VFSGALLLPSTLPGAEHLFIPVVLFVQGTLQLGETQRTELTFRERLTAVTNLLCSA